MTNAIPDQDILDKTLTILIDELELDLDPQAVDLDADLAEDYDADSLALIQILARVNKELSIRVPSTDIPRLRTARLLVTEITRLRDVRDPDQ